VQRVCLGGETLRRRLEGAGATLDFGVLTELKAQGATDYLALPIPSIHGRSSDPEPARRIVALTAQSQQVLVQALGQIKFATGDVVAGCTQMESEGILRGNPAAPTILVPGHRLGRIAAPHPRQCEVRARLAGV
jgi:hypothetical protein